MFSGKLQKGLLKVFYKQGKCWFSNTINIIFANLKVTFLHENNFINMDKMESFLKSN